jgi:23S rRNA (adenine2503-C2)-methyltransferase
MKLPFRPNLAISLNGSDNNNRNLVMPVNKAYPIESLMEALKEYKLESFRKITFEYVILDGINDTIEDAKKVLNLVREVPSKVNIIPFNPHHGSEFKRPDDSKVEAFQKFLEKNGVYSTIRYSRGRDILAACGQLKSAQENLAQKNLALKNSMKENLVQ